MSNERYSQFLKVSSSDGKNKVESFLNDIQKRADKAKVEFGVDITVERVQEPTEHNTQFDE